VSSPTVPHRPPPSPTVPHHPPPSPVVPHHLPPSSAVFRCFPMFSAVPCCPPSSPAVLCKHLPSPTRRCLTSWGSSSFLMTAVHEVQGRERTAFCRPVRSFSKVARQVGIKDEDGPRFAVPSRPGLLAVPPPGPTGAPDGCQHWVSIKTTLLRVSDFLRFDATETFFIPLCSWRRAQRSPAIRFRIGAVVVEELAIEF